MNPTEEILVSIEDAKDCPFCGHRFGYWRIKEDVEGEYCGCLNKACPFRPMARKGAHWPKEEYNQKWNTRVPQTQTEEKK